VISVEGVTHAYGDREVLRDVTVTLQERRIAVIGANGSGKSTFARLLNGLVTPSRGRVLVDGFDTRSHGREVRRRVGFVFQNPDAQIVLPTVAEDVAFSLHNRGMDAREVDARVAAALARHGLAGHADHPAHLLSEGQKQLLALCAVLVLEPAYVVLDEPTTLLDRRNTRAVADVVAGLAARVVLVTHDLDLAGRCERVLVFDDGRLVADATPDRAVATYLELVG
jgi:biotin transport system ATP-binding protein